MKNDDQPAEKPCDPSQPQIDSNLYQVGNRYLNQQETAKNVEVRFDQKLTWGLYVHQRVVRGTAGQIVDINLALKDVSPACQHVRF